MGSTIGEAFGSGIASIPGGFLKPFGINFGDSSKEPPPPTNPQTPFNPFQAFNPLSWFQLGLGLGQGANNPPLSDPSIVNQGNRTNSDSGGTTYYGSSPTVPSFARPRASSRITSVRTSGGSISSVTRRVSAKGGRGSAVTRSLSKSKAKARASARRKGKACYNQATEMGGVERIDYRYPYM